MTTNWKIVRVFISSTFRDTQAERDHSVRFVFPRLREHLLPRRIHLAEVDLRWGVTSEQDATEVCREIIDECRPRFLCMLGGRYGWVPPGKNRSITAEEVHYSVLHQTLKDRGFAYFYFRDEAATAAMVETTPGEFREPQGSDSQTRLTALKQAIIAAGLNPFTYPAQWDSESRRLTGLKQFGERVHDDLLDSMKSDPELREHFAMATAAQLDELTEESAAMEEFVEERSARFVLGSRGAVLEELLAHASTTGGNGYVCLTGAPGSGKSALLAHLSRHSTLNPQSSTLLIRHFVGASPGSTDVRRTLRRLCQELKVGCSDITADIPDDLEKLRVAFPNFLRQVCARQRVVILLDAVNQFDPALHSDGLHWLPEDLPANARVILSALDGPALEELRRRSRKPCELELKPLTAADGEAIIEQFRQRYRKNFEPEQRAALLVKADAGTPLYLLAALEELRTLGTYEEITRRIAELPLTTRELFVWILERLENDDGFRDAAGRRVGRELVSRFSTLLAASRHGLSQRELAGLLDVGDPQGNVAALLHLLRPYLMRRGELLDFFHGQLREAVMHRYSPADLAVCHTDIARYFETRWRDRDRHALAELPYHQASAGLWEKYTANLTNFTFLAEKLKAWGPMAIVDDCDLSGLMDVVDRREPIRALRLIREAIRMSANVLARNPSELGGQLLGRLLGEDSLEIGGLLGSVRPLDGSAWLRPLKRSLNRPGSGTITILRGHRWVINAVAVTPDGRRAISCASGKLKVWDLEAGISIRDISGDWGEAHAVAITSNGRLGASGGVDGKVRLWDLESGEPLQVLPGYGTKFGQVHAVVFAINGRLLISGSNGGFLRSWDVGGGNEIYSLQAHPEAVNALAVADDAGIVLSASTDGTVKAWDLVTGRALHALHGHHGPVNAVAVSADGCIAVSGSRDTMNVWDLASLNKIWTLSGHTAQVRAVALTRDKRQAVSSSDDRTIKLWDLTNGLELFGFHTGASHCEALALTADGSRAITGSNDTTAQIWDLAARGEMGRPDHRGTVKHVCVSSQGQRIVSAADDGTIKVWDLLSGVELMHFSGAYLDTIWDMALSVDGRILISHSIDDALHVFDLTQGLELQTLRGHSDRIWEVKISSDGRCAVSRSGDGTVKVWNLKAGALIHTLNNPDLRSVLGMSPDGRIVVSCGSVLHVWDLEDLSHVTEVRGYPYGPTEAIVSGDATRVVTCAIDGTVVVSDLVNGKKQLHLPGHSQKWGVISCIGFDVSPDFGYAVLGFSNGILWVWDLRTGTKRHTIIGHSGDVTSVVVTANGSRAISCGYDQAIKVWDVVRGELVCGFHVEATPTSCGASADGRYLIAGDMTGRLHFFRLEE